MKKMFTLIALMALCVVPSFAAVTTDSDTVTVTLTIEKYVDILLETNVLTLTPVVTEDGGIASIVQGTVGLTVFTNCAATLGAVIDEDEFDDADGDFYAIAVIDDTSVPTKTGDSGVHRTLTVTVSGISLEDLAKDYTASVELTVTAS